MTQEAFSPTPERLRRSRWDIPEVDSKTNRRAYKARDVFMELLREEKIDGAQFQASERFQRHMEGAEGHDVRVVDMAGNPCDERQPARTLHAMHLSDAQKELTDKQFRALVCLCQQSSNMAQVGFGASGYVCAKTARGYGLCLVETALERLAYMWGMKQRQTVPIR
jgi:hypothetical protein